MKLSISIRLLSFCVLIFSCAYLSFGQSSPLIKGKVINHFTNEPISFASVRWKRGETGVVTDSAGSFSLRVSKQIPDTLIVSYIGFDDLLHPFHPAKDTGELILALPQLKLSHAVEVKTKFSKGLRWWNAIVAHKKDNNPYQYNNYSYELYNKLELDVNNINRKIFENKKLLKPFSFVLDNTDSTSELKPFLPIFLTESLSNYYYSNHPYRAKEEIKAVQTNGIKNETVLQFLGGISQKINLYEDYITVFGKEFISPLSYFGDKYYYYKGADTQIINHRKYFHLFFTPKQDGSNTFVGDCWIHSTTWAIQKIEVNISASANINFVQRLSIIQEFSQRADQKWVFAKDKFIADISPIKKDKLSFIGRKTAIYKDVKVNLSSIDSLLATNKKREEISVKINANSQSKNFWNDNRYEPLSLNEDKVYTMIDTLKEMPLFKKYSNTIAFIFDGHKKLGMIEIGPWFKWISGNQLEKVRLRFDLGTTEKFSKHLRLNGYLAYGFKDATWKGKLGLDYKLNHHESWSIQSSYKNGLDNGRIRFNEDEEASIDNLFSQVIRRQSIPQKFLGVEEIRLGITKEWQQQFTTQVFINNTKYKTYAPLPSQQFFSLTGNDVTTTEAGIKIRYAPGEKHIETHRKTIRIKGSEPVIEAKYIVSFPSFLKSEYSYHKLSLMASQRFKIPRWGTIEYSVYGGKYFGDSIPFMLLEIHPGNEVYYYNKNSFNLMNRFEYFSDQYIGFNMEYNFEKKLLNLVPFLRKTKMRQFINIKTVKGDLTSANKKFNKLEFAGYRLKRLRGDNYTEIGTGIENIFKFFRVDLVWRLAPDFIVPPSSTVPNTPTNFGIFGSFQLQF